MMKRIFKLWTTAALCMMLPAIFASAQTAVHQERLWEYWSKSETYLTHEADVLLDLVDRTLQAYPPTPSPSVERRLALTALDAVLHQTRNDDSPELHAFLDTRIARVLAEMDAPAPENGLELWKLYNDGFVVRSRSLTLGFDLCGTRGSRTFIPDSLMRAIVRRCDALFISHRDPDHADRTVVALAAEAGVPVYGPEDFQDDRFTPVRREDFGTMDLPIRDGRTVRVQPLPGHQDGLQNNIYVVTFPEGTTFAHCGDQYLKEDMAWLGTVAEKMARPLDVLVIDCWAMDLQETILGFKPRTVVFGHENELGHSIDHREAFWQSQYKLDTLQLPMPAYLLAWGERCLLR